MKHLELLDCTLRDGGYVNNWAFPYKHIKDTIKGLVEAHIDIIECGYTSPKKPDLLNSSYYSDIKNICKVLPPDPKGSQFVVMINYGEYDLSEIPDCSESGIDGIRVVFHKKDKANAVSFCEGLINKGYKVFFQPMVALSYTDEEFLELIRKANEMAPYAFYIVDSFGAMKADDLLHLFYLVDYNLSPSIRLGFHSHNNLQLSYSHAQMLANQQTERTVIIDASIMGMGRGAGNLNTELFAEYLNRTTSAHYHIPSLLKIMDQVIAPIYQNKYWGYSLPHYLSATHNCHPNYASYLDEKNTLTYENIHEIFQMMLPEKKVSFDKTYIQNLYLEYQSKQKYNFNLKELRQQMTGKDILILAPGRSIRDEEERIKNFIQTQNPIVIAVNFLPERLPEDYIFVSNLRRWENLKAFNEKQVILTSNLGIESTNINGYVVDYSSLLNEQDKVKDNASMMLLELLYQLGAEKVYLAGLDGYSMEEKSNFAQPSMEFHKSSSTMQAMNKGMSIVLSHYAQKISIVFITKPRYVYLESGDC